jgi:hypothetical protein
MNAFFVFLKTACVVCSFDVGSRALGVPEKDNFVTVDLYEGKKCCWEISFIHNKRKYTLFLSFFLSLSTHSFVLRQESWSSGVEYSFIETIERLRFRETNNRRSDEGKIA